MACRRSAVRSRLAPPSRIRAWFYRLKFLTSDGNFGKVKVARFAELISPYRNLVKLGFTSKISVPFV